MNDSQHPEELSNIVAAMNKVADTLDIKIPLSVTEDGGPADKQVLIRTTEEERQNWKNAASKEGKTVSAWIRELLNRESDKALNCQHQNLKIYPWAKICLDCRQRL